MKGKSLGRRIFVLLLLPVVFLGTSREVAQAATQTERLHIKLNGDNQLTTNCYLPLAAGKSNHDSTITIGNSGFCQSGPDPSIGWCNMFEAGCTTVTVTAANQMQGCGSTNLDVISDEGRLVVTTHLGAGFINVGSCVPTRICVKIVGTGTWQEDGEVEGCADTSLEFETAPLLQGCPDGSIPEEPHVTTPYRYEVDKVYHLAHGRYDRMFRASNGPTSTNAGWQFYIITNGRASDDGPYLGAPVPGWADDRRYVNWYVKRVPGVDTYVPLDYEIYTGLSQTSTMDAYVRGHKIIGYGVFPVPGNVYELNRPGYGIGVPGTLSSQGLFGITDPTRCAFYWGDRITTLPGTNMNEPVGPITDPSVEVPPPLPPEIEPPPADDSVSGFGWLASLLTKLIQAVLGLVQGILTGIKALFVPSDGFFKAQMARLDGALDDSTPGKYMAAVEQLAPTASSAAGCAGPTLDLTIGGQEIHAQPLSACSGVTATMAGLCRSILTVGLVIFGGLACIRAIGSGLGWNPGVGGGAP